MARTGRKEIATGPKSAWNAMLDQANESDPTQAGEVPEGLEDGLGGGDKGRDADTGTGGYAGDVAEAGQLEALAQPEMPLDPELNDPRTAEGESYPDELKKADHDQRQIGAAAEEIEDEEEEQEEDDEDFG